MPMITPEELARIRPDIFTLKPRAGGSVKIKPFKGADGSVVETGSEMDKKKKTTIPDYISRQYRVEKAMNAIFPAKEAMPIAKPQISALDLLSISLSTVMCLAAGAQTITQRHLNWTKSYLGNVKTDLNVNPPNIRALLNHLDFSEQSGNLVVAPDPDEEAPGGDGAIESGRTVRTQITVTKRD